MRIARLTVVYVAISALFVLPARAEQSSQFPSEPLKPSMTVGKVAALSVADTNRAINAVTSVGASGYAISFPFIGLTAHKRGTTEIMKLTDKWRVPMSAMVISQEFIRTMGGEAMANAAVPGQLLLGESAAKIRRAQVGDTFVLRGTQFQPITFTVGAIVPDAFVDWGDITISRESANAFGKMKTSSVMITDIPSYSKVAQALRAKGIENRGAWRYRRSWDLESPDGTLGTSSVKKMLGEFAYRPVGGFGIEVDGAWRGQNLNYKQMFQDISLLNNCHKEVAPAIQGALTEIRKAGLASKIDIRNTNRYGGCFAARYNRRAGIYGSVARHAWGMAIDMNTTANAQGGIPTLNCTIVRIFRKWGFAWGGNFQLPDGMHFEYVGKPLDQLGYPSKYCPNLVPIPTTTLPKFDDDVPVTTTTTTSPPTTSTPTTLPPTITS